MSESAGWSLGVVASCTPLRRVVADTAIEQAQLQRQGDEALLGAVMQVALEPPALGVAGRDDALPRRPQLGSCPQRPGPQVLVLERDSRRGADRLDEIGVVVERGVVYERGDFLPLSLDERGGPSGRWA